jgi:hypothetical protein
VARRGSLRSSCPACHQSPQVFRTAVTMESVETPVKDGILYQQHIKFGKVGTPGHQAVTQGQRWPEKAASALDSPPRPGGSGWGWSPGIQEWNTPSPGPESVGANQAFIRPFLIFWGGKSRSGKGLRVATSQQGRALGLLTHVLVAELEECPEVEHCHTQAGPPPLSWEERTRGVHLSSGGQQAPHPYSSTLPLLPQADKRSVSFARSYLHVSFLAGMRLRPPSHCWACGLNVPM